MTKDLFFHCADYDGLKSTAGGEPTDDRGNMLNYYDQVEDAEPVLHKQAMGATYEEHFLQDLRTLEEKRQRRPPTRYDEELYYAAEALTADINEPMNVKEAWTTEYPFQ